MKPELSDEQRELIAQELCKLRESSSFRASTRMSDFLDYIAEAELEGIGDELNQTRIAIDVYGRDGSFDPAIDSVVRVEASRLRTKLKEYYREHGDDSLVTIDLPKGRYSPTFLFGESPTDSKSKSPVYSPSVQSDRPAAPEKSIAVLPFENRSELKDDAFFTDGIHDDLLTQISRIRDIRTVSRTSVMAYRNAAKNLRTIGEELGVSTLLEGGVQRAGDQIRVTAQLIDAKTDYHLWAKTYTRQMTAENVFAIQSEIATEIAKALEATLTPNEKKRIEKLPTQNFAAMEAFFKSRTSWDKQTVEGFQELIGHLEQAIKHDPNFAAAHAQLAIAHLSLVFYCGYAISYQAKKAAPHITRAIELDDQLGEAYIASGILYEYQGKLSEAETAFKKGVELNPNFAWGFGSYAHFMHWRRWNLPKAIELYRTAEQLEPSNPVIAQHLSEALSATGRFAEAEIVLQNCIAAHPHFAQAYRALADLYRDAYHRFDKALRHYRKAHDLDPQAPNILGTMVWVYRLIDDKEASLASAKSALALVKSPNDRAYYQGWIYQLQGDAEATYEECSKIETTYIYYGYPLRILGHEDYQQGRYESAIERVRKAHPAILDNEQAINVFEFAPAVEAAYILKAIGKTKKSERLIERCLETMKTLPRMGLVGINYTDALIYNFQGKTDKALAALREFVDSGGTSIYIKDWFYLQNLRDEPEFIEQTAIMDSRLAQQRANLKSWTAEDAKPAMTI